MSKSRSQRRRDQRRATELARKTARNANGERATGKPAGTTAQKRRATGGKQTRFRLRLPNSTAVQITLAVAALLFGGGVLKIVIPWIENLGRTAPPTLALSDLALATTGSGRGNITFNVTNRSTQPQILWTVGWIPHGVPNPPVADSSSHISLSSYDLQPGESTAGSISFSRTGVEELEQTETSDVLVYVNDTRGRESGADVGLTWGRVTSVTTAGDLHEPEVTGAHLRCRFPSRPAFGDQSTPSTSESSSTTTTQTEPALGGGAAYMPPDDYC